MFELEYLGDGQLAMRASNGKYVSAHFNGSLCAINDSIEAKNRFVMTLVNRPVLVLMCDYGFVGAKTAGGSRLECNKALYDYILVESNGVRVVIDPKSALFVGGSELDYSGDLQHGGFKVSNPNAVVTCSCGESFAA